ncbi:MAG: DUF1207 domain-containing protein [Planctomycetota bacterium]|nr:MAG: DUF1207 domain-containing protein [Planctomycetota bacterium]REK25482.1 MAG: DUF1207 domain-containing protein [Planctomycetota bacterium]REK45918.1 MAG: DUF1207 domain-containing protein [Planctomycetota bacterium]
MRTPLEHPRSALAPRLRQAGCGWPLGGRVTRVAVVAATMALLNVGIADAQWRATWNLPQPQFAATPPTAARQATTTAKAARDVPTILYGGHGQPARVLPKPGVVAWSRSAPQATTAWRPQETLAQAPQPPAATRPHTQSQPTFGPVGFTPVGFTPVTYGPSAAGPVCYARDPYPHEGPGCGAGEPNFECCSGQSLLQEFLEPYRHFGAGAAARSGQPWTWHILPERLIFPTYLAGVKEPRMGAVLNYENNDGVKWDLSIGGRFGVVRFGTPDGGPLEGWQLDVEAAAQPRLDPEENMDLEATDYRFGVPLTYGVGRYRMKIGYFHLSSHLGDEFAIRNGLGGRINYSRDAILWGHSYRVTEELTAYFEVGYGFHTDVNEPWGFQFGFDWSPPCTCGFHPVPFFAVNGHLREENDYGGNFVAQAGWQWRSGPDRRLLRMGVQYFNGQHERYEFFDTSEQKIGLGIWYDF